MWKDFLNRILGGVGSGATIEPIQDTSPRTDYSLYALIAVFLVILIVAMYFLTKKK